MVRVRELRVDYEMSAIDAVGVVYSFLIRGMRRCCCCR